MPNNVVENGIRYRNLSLGYDFQWQNPGDALGELKRVMYVLEDESWNDWKRGYVI